MPVFRGSYEHTMDDRGRVALPSRYRADFARGAVLRMSEDGCVEIYTPEGFDEMTKDVAVASRTTLQGRQSRRQFYGQAFDAELDRQGRVLVPQSLRQQAGLDGPVIIMGCLECMEIWNPERRRRFEEAQRASSATQGSSE